MALLVHAGSSEQDISRPATDTLHDLVAVGGLVKRYRDTIALDHFSLHIAPGEIF